MWTRSLCICLVVLSEQTIGMLSLYGLNVINPKFLFKQTSFRKMANLDKYHFRHNERRHAVVNQARV